MGRGAGKSTFRYIALYFLGQGASHSTSLKNFKSRFGLSALELKLLLIINDMSYNKGEEPQILKELISGDKMKGEAKYQKPVSFLPVLWVLIASFSI